MKKILIGSLIASSILMGSNSIQVNINSDTLEVSSDIYLNNYYNLSEKSNYYLEKLPIYHLVCNKLPH